MDNGIQGKGLRPLEKRGAQVGFILVGVAIIVTGVSYLQNMTFDPQWLVWVIGAAFIGAGLIAVEWSRAMGNPSGQVPSGGALRTFLLAAMPLAYVLGSNICGPGLKACSTTCNLITAALIVLTIVIVVRLVRGQSIGLPLVATVILSLVPHCVCGAPINVVWHGVFGNYSPTCGLMPLATVLFSIAALKRARPRLSAVLVIVMLAMIVFVAAGNAVWGFPWEGCV